MFNVNPIPDFGCLDGVKVVVNATSVAGPFTGSMMADHGADVIWIESVEAIPIDRTGTTELKKKPFWLEQDRRNMRSLKINFKNGSGREAFMKLMAETDIFIEASKGGAMDRLGLSDETLWEVNPKLIIIHINGFGSTGVPEYVSRASYDTIAQAYGGMMYANSRPDTPPVGMIPYVADMYTGWAALSSALMAYIKMLKTGKGESVDVAQVEAIIRCSTLSGCNAWNYGENDKLKFVPGDFNSRTAGYNTYKCKDGNYILLLLFGVPVLKKACKIFGVEYGSEDFPAKPLYKTFDPEGQRWDALISDFCMKYDAKELEKYLASEGLPAACVLSYDDMLENPQLIARDAITTVHSKDWGDRDIRVSNVFPRMKNNPGRIWKEAPHGGEDTEAILKGLGYTDEQIAVMMEEKMVGGLHPVFN